ncbi:phosphatase PAP2 family protein [Pedobacter ureilyticus]|uniref:Phosphatase PAP2 family protein n=1 Tax=Pedobacter ureilyticus TaxID=1393051 RepID=A0ABW9JAD3_9SPHI|nr:phosphatase PAP2 family protein [Pedobacter helvus]
MMQELIQFDTELFLKIHRGLTNEFFDWIMPLIRNRFFWSPLYLFIVIFCIKQYKKAGLYIIGGVLLAFALGDGISAKIIKPNVGRIRPCNEVRLADQIIHRVPCGGGKSFPSSHATNHFAIAVFLIGVFYRKWKAILPIGIAWAAAISFAQVYVGVHYPIDVFCGMILGILIGLLTISIYRYAEKKVLKRTIVQIN